MTETLRFGLIGCGRIAVDVHIPDLRKAGAEVVALADVAPGRAARFAEQFGIPRGFDDYRELLALPEVDAVSVAVPTCAHEEVATAALAAGKRVYLEKPPAMNAAEFRRVADAAASAPCGTPALMVGSQSIYGGAVPVLKPRIDAGDLGEVYLAKAQYTERRGAPHGWIRLKEFAGGGAGIDGMSHILDRVLYLLDCPRVRSVVGRTYHAFAEYPSRSPYMDMDFAEGRCEDAPVSDVEDLATGFVQFANGCSLILESAKTVNAPNGGDTWLYGTKAGARLDPPTLFTEDAAGVLADTVLQPPNVGSWHAAMFRHFLDCIREGRQTLSPPARGLAIMQIIDALYESAADGGRQIELKEQSSDGSQAK